MYQKNIRKKYNNYKCYYHIFFSTFEKKYIFEHKTNDNYRVFWKQLKLSIKPSEKKIRKQNIFILKHKQN